MGKKNKNRKKRKNKSKSRSKVATSTLQRRSLRQIPEILGADFQPFHNDIEELEKQINALPKSDHKRRILFSTEASYLYTGFSTYLREVMRRLHATGKYELAELGSYGNSPEIDPRAKQIPWKYYHNLPTSAIEEAEYKKDYKENQFGKWRLSYVLADFKPDIILLNRDNWMDTHVLKNQLRNNCLVFWMPTVDGFPQKWTWTQDYSKLDKLFTYSWFGKRVLEEQSRCPLAKRYGIKELRVDDVIQPGVNLDVFRPLPREEVHQFFNVPDKRFRFVGTVMRNQPRKLYPRIIESFRMFKEQHPVLAENVFLLLHASVPDVGWDIPEHVRQNGLDEDVVFSYICKACGQCGLANFRGSPTDCPICGNKGTFQTPNTQFGYSEEQFKYVFNILDVYIQGTIAEGDGMPINEAKACGVPILGSDYSAVYEKVRNGGGLPIRNLSEKPSLASYTEHETGQNRSLFDRQDLCDKLALLLGDEPYRKKLALEARECAEKYYSWDLTAKKWEYWIDEAKVKDRKDTWESPVELKNITEESPEDTLSDEEFVEWLYLHILSGKKPDSEGFRTWTQTLQRSGPPGSEGNQKCRKQLEDWFRNKIRKENEEKKVREKPELALVNPVERTAALLNPEDKFRILYAIPETWGDCLISTGVIDGIKKKWPHATVYVATQEQYFVLFEGNSQVERCVPYHESMLNYRAFEKWGPEGDNLFDIVFNPYIVTQKIPHWIHNGHGPWLGQAYANMCNVEFGQMRIQEDDSILKELPEEYITVQSQTRTDPKDWDYFDDVLERINDLPVVHIGGKKDKNLACEVIDLRGKTSIAQVASVIKNARMHLGGDSFHMHIAGLMKTPSVIVFGGTYKQQGYAPCYAPHIKAIETEDRGPCYTSCHLLECEAKKMGFDKCINNIPVEKVMAEVQGILGEDHVEPLEEISLSSYVIIRDGEKYGFPYIAAINAACEVSDEVVVVDGGSTDGTLDILNDMAQKNDKIQIHQHEWDFDNPTLFGDEKTYARQLCTSTHVIQLDADEIISEPRPGAIRDLVRKHRFDDVVDLPCINFYENDTTIRAEANCWKWRISRNDPNILHGVTKQFRIMDPMTGRIAMDKNKSDGCEYIYADTLEICRHKFGFNAKFLEVHEKLKRGLIDPQEYADFVKKIVEEGPVVFHYSWFDLSRKQQNGELWDKTWHGQRNATYNTTQNIQSRVAQKNKERLIPINFNHPLKMQKA